MSSHEEFDDVFADDGILTSWAGHPDRLADRPELSERQPAAPLLVKVQELVVQGVEYGVDRARRHRKAAATIGGTVLGTLGFATGAAVFSNRHAH